jgi:hypothetical protein
MIVERREPRTVTTDGDEPADRPDPSHVVAAIEQHVQSLVGLEEVALTEHVEHYQRVHAALQAALTGIDGA